METIWHVLLTVCIGSTCIDQDVQWFDSKEQCTEMLEVYANIPNDGTWDKVTWQCKPKNQK